jgi:uncharacterized protein (TIGR01777 family)
MPLVRPLRIVIPGGTGHLGMLLGRHFHELGHSVATITRFPKPHAWEAVHWDAENMGYWASSLEGADAVINLAGRSMVCRYTANNKKSILHSRVRTTQLLADAIDQCSNPPRVWLNASSANIYPHSLACAMDEDSDLAASSKWQFSRDVANAWEQAVFSSPTPRTRKILLRLAPVMSPETSGAFNCLLRLVRLGLGGEIGDGEQYVCWLHDFDFIRAIEFLIERDHLQGPVNMVAPNPMPNHQFMCNLRRAWCTSYFGLPAPEWLVQLVSFMIRTEPELLLKSRRVVPGQLLKAEFSFHFPEWRGACENLVQRWRLLQTS